MRIETQIALQDNALERGLWRVGQLSPYTCPTYHGLLLELKAGRFIRFRCHTGHAFSARSLLADLTESIDDALWNTLHTLDESVLLLEHLAAHLREEGQDASTAALFTQHAQEAQQRGEVVRRLVMQRPARPPATVQEDAPGTDDEDTTP